jgi:hypothetical protein
LSKDDTAGILLYSNGAFKVVSNVQWELGANNQATTVGHLGDKLANVSPMQMNPNDILGNVYVLLHDGDKDDQQLPSLNPLKVTRHLATDTIHDADGVEHTFFGASANMDSPPDLTNMRIALFPMVGYHQRFRCKLLEHACQQAESHQ